MAEMTPSTDRALPSDDELRRWEDESELIADEDAPDYHAQRRRDFASRVLQGSTDRPTVQSELERLKDTPGLFNNPAPTETE